MFFNTLADIYSYFSVKVDGPYLMGLELTADRHPPITSQTCWQLHHAVPLKLPLLHWAI